MQSLTFESSYEHILKSNDFESLRIVRDQVHEMLRMHPLLDDPRHMNLELNQLHDAFIRRSIVISENLLSAQGLGSPPISYAFILFGSGGRAEQTLWSDQDNGLIYDEPDKAHAEIVHTYFKLLSNQIVDGLIQLGYPPCEGKVLCSNPVWRKTLTAWRLTVQEWLMDPNWENIRNLLILADFRCLYGSDQLVFELRNEFLDFIKAHPPILESILRNTLHRKSSLGAFGRLVTERYGEDAGGIDIKYGSYIPMVNGIRLLAIQAGLHETSTLERILALVKQQLISAQNGEEWTKAFHLNLYMRSITPFQFKEGIYTSRGKLTAEQLTKPIRQDLKFILHVGIDLQKYVKKQVHDVLEQIEQ